jgi:molybdopterin converting factor subunit 1
MKIDILAFGIAKNIIGASTYQIQVEENPMISKLREQLIAEFPDFERLKSLRFAVNEEYVDESYILKENDEVVIIPPVSGG